MMLLGGIGSLSGPVVGAAAYKLMQVELAAATDFWRALLGCGIVVLVLLFPRGIAGQAQRRVVDVHEEVRVFRQRAAAVGADGVGNRGLLRRRQIEITEIIAAELQPLAAVGDRKSTRLNSSH